jgi:catechol 2,3-dioxygenase
MTQTSIPAQTHIGHVHLKVADLDRTVDFYHGIMGFDVITRIGTNAAFLSAGGYHHHLGLNTWESKNGSPPPRHSTGLYHFAINYPTRKDLAIALKRLLRAGWAIDGASDHRTHEALYLSDPDGNGIELAWDRERSYWFKDDGSWAAGTYPLDIQGLLAEAGEEQDWPNGAIPAATRIGHVHLKVADLERALHFYGDLLGFDLIGRFGADAGFVSAGGYHHHIGLNTWESRNGSPPPPGATGLYHFAINYPTRRDLAAAVKRLFDNGWSIDGLNDHGTHMAIYLHDPDMNGIELAWDRQRSEWPRNADGGINLVGGRWFDVNALAAEAETTPLPARP